MKLLHMQIESCMSCPFMEVTWDPKRVVISCRDREAHPEVNRYVSRTILTELGSHDAKDIEQILTDVEIPEWCPLEYTEDGLPEQWYVIHGNRADYRLESNKGNCIMLTDCIPLETAKIMAAAPVLLDALCKLEPHIDDTEGAYPPDKMVLMLDKDLIQSIRSAIARARGDGIEFTE